MIFLVDAQLPPLLAVRLMAAGHDARHIGDRAELDTPDARIADLAAAMGAVIITKDRDFVALCLAHEPVVPLLWVRLGNCGNLQLISAVLSAIPAAVAAFAIGETIVELR